MSIKLLLKATRPDQSVDFWWDTDTEDVQTAKSQTVHLFSTLGISETIEYSSDRLECTRVIVAPSIDAWNQFMDGVISVPHLLTARKDYFNAHGHVLTLTKMDLDTDSVFEVIPDVITHLS